MTMLLLAACGSSDEGTTSGSDSDKKVIKIGMEAAYAPFNWSQKDDANGGVQIASSKEFAAGYDVEIAKKLQKVWTWNYKLLKQTGMA